MGIADGMKQSLQQAAMVASATAATEAARMKRTEDAAPAQQIKLDRSSATVNSLVDGAQGSLEQSNPSCEAVNLPLNSSSWSSSLPQGEPDKPTGSQLHPLELALFPRDGGPFDPLWLPYEKHL